MMQTTLLRILRAVTHRNIVRRRATQASLHKRICHVHLIMALSLVNVWIVHQRLDTSNSICILNVYLLAIKSCLLAVKSCWYDELSVADRPVHTHKCVLPQGSALLRSASMSSRASGAYGLGGTAP